jgi:hypothetical protein
LSRGNHGVAGHLTHGVAAVCSIDQREFAGILSQQFRDSPQDARALERDDGAPLGEAAVGRGDGGSDIGRVGDGDASQ